MSRVYQAADVYNATRDVNLYEWVSGLEARIRELEGRVRRIRELEALLERRNEDWEAKDAAWRVEAQHWADRAKELEAALREIADEHVTGPGWAEDFQDIARRVLQGERDG